jgi:hypothetical protein
MAREIPLGRGKVAIVDDEDYEYLIQWKWHTKNMKYASRSIHTSAGIVTALMHRVILQAPKGVDVDHINGNGFDNRRSQNLCNQRPQSNCTSQYRGVWWDNRSNRWVATITVNRKTKWVGAFSDELEAARAWDEAARDLHGEFARLNLS